jgi:Cytochrome c7 and related cytochrome c/Class III cytochrome C family
MPAFQEPTSDSKKARSDSTVGGSPRSGVLALLAVALLVAVTVPLVAGRRPPAVTQPIAFSHKVHTVDLQLGCTFCHKYVNTSAHSGLPDAQTCAMCHTIKQGESEEAARLTETLQAGDSLQFNKLFRLPDYVFYTHRRHVGIAELECTNCHGGIAETERPPERPLVNVKMALCVDCHEKREVTTDCTSCHR